MQEKKTPAFRTKVLNMIVPQVIPADVIEHLWVRRRQGIWDQLHPHQAHSRQPVGCSSEGETTRRGTTFHLYCFIKSLPRSCCSCSKWKHLQAPAFSSIFLSVSETQTCVLYFKIHLCHRLSIIFEGWAKFKKLISSSWNEKTGRKFP